MLRGRLRLCLGRVRLVRRLKTQRPDKSMTKDELLRLMKTGQLGHLQSPSGAGATAPGVGERSGHQDRPGAFPGAPRPGSAPLPGGPAVRRPGSAQARIRARP